MHLFCYEVQSNGSYRRSLVTWNDAIGRRPLSRIFFCAPFRLFLYGINNLKPGLPPPICDPDAGPSGAVGELRQVGPESLRILAPILARTGGMSHFEKPRATILIGHRAQPADRARKAIGADETGRCHGSFGKSPPLNSAWIGNRARPESVARS